MSVAAKASFKYINYQAAVISNAIKDHGRYCKAMNAMLMANGWTDDEFIKYREPKN